MRRGFKIRLITAFSAAAAMAALAVPAAQAAQAAPAAQTPGTYCNQSGAGLCLSSLGTPGGNINADRPSSAAREQWQAVTIGKVGMGGLNPFSISSFNTDTYHGKPILLIENMADTDVCALGRGGSVINGSCSAVGHLWVDTGNAAHPNQTPISVLETDTIGSSVWLVSDGNPGDGAQLSIATHNAWRNG
jgi:hypothetical protein